MAKTKQMTLEQADAARRRAVTMLENFDDSEGADEFDSMSASEYAEHKGIEIVASNPNHVRRGATASQSQKKGNAMGLKNSQHEQLESWINTRGEEALKSNSRVEMREALEEITDLTGDDVTITFNEDGSVELETADPDADEENDED
jgi:hypothetical protein